MNKWYTQPSPHSQQKLNSASTELKMNSILLKQRPWNFKTFFMSLFKYIIQNPLLASFKYTYDQIEKLTLLLKG